MAIARILGFEHLPSGFGNLDNGILWNAAVCFGLAASDLGATCSIAASSNGMCLRVESKRMAFGKWTTGNATAAAALTTLTLSSFTTETAAKKIIIGFRYEIAKVCTNSQPMMTIGNKAAAAETAYGQVISAFWQAASQPVGEQGYCELVLDFVAGTFTAMKDGVATNTGSLGTLTAANFKDHFWCVGRKDVGQAVTTGADIWFYIGDVYCVVDTGDVNDPFRDPLGPIDVRRMTASNVTGSWAASDSSALSVVVNGKKTTTADLNTPYISNQNDTAVLSMDLTVSIPNGGKLLGFDATLGAYHDGGVSGNLKASWTVDGTAKPDVTVTVPTLGATALKDLRAGVSSNPNGVGTVNLKLTPI